ncbi:acyltransferase family protein [Paratractidigestivibacter sp.]|uniref:acyltransferase family protein n=1 Tax=Paratractidigestivibacter sp. TaxID=2847316 RepID=UPI002ABD327A|nr:acyltransferase family protein [Paratractidigestivibacter sp.]
MPCLKNAEHTPAPKRVAGLDGLRVLAIAAVVAYHADQARFPGGFIGVTVFFVLAGYLTTLSVARKLSSDEGFSYPRFIGKKVARLLPSMLAVVAVTAVLALAFSPALLTKEKADVVPALLFFQNVHYIVRKVSYFAAAGLPSPLTHFWYLGVLMQYYLVWPLLLMGAWKINAKRRALTIVTLILAIASAVCMGILFDPSGDTARIYYGPDTRAGELLVGSALALATLGKGLSKGFELLPEGVAAALRVRWGDLRQVVAALSFAGICALAWFSNGYTAFAYRGGIALAAVLTALLIGVLAEDEAPTVVGRVLGIRPLAYLSQRSFAVYLWHYPLLLIMNPATRTTAIPWWGWVVEILIILAASEISFSVFEKGVAALGERGPLGQQKPVLVFEAVCLVVATAVCVVPMGDAANTRPQTESMTAEERKAQAEAVAVAKEAAQKETYDLANTYFKDTEFAKAVESINATNFSVDAETGATDASVTLVGDSIPEDASAEFYEIFPNGYMDAKIGRQMTAGVEAYEECKAAGHEGDVVVWSIADNGWITEDQVRALVECVDSSKKVYFLTCRCPDAWQDANNEIIHNVVAQYENATVIDWYAESEGHDEWFWNDGEHVRPEGAEAYVKMLRRYITGR